MNETLRKGGTWVAGRALLDSLMDAGLIDAIGGPLASSWWHKIGIALGERGYAVVPLAALDILDVRLVARIFEGDIGARMYFYGAAYGHPEDESYDKIATDFVAAYLVAYRETKENNQ